MITAGAVAGLRQMPGAMPARCPQSGSGPDASADALAAWAASIARRAGQSPGGGLKFAFYGRVPTEDWQDPVTSRARQREQAAVQVAGHGKVVAEFFDSGESRMLPWPRRPQAAALVGALADPDRGGTRS